MEIRAENLNPKEKDTYISQTLDSQQFKIIYNAIKGQGFLLNRKKIIVIKLINSDFNEQGIRVDIIYDIISNTNNPTILDIESFYHNDLKQETTAYIIEGNLLLTEFFTDEQLSKKQQYLVNKWNRDIILTEREDNQGRLLG